MKNKIISIKTGEIYDGVKEAAYFLGISASAVSQACNDGPSKHMLAWERDRDNMIRFYNHRNPAERFREFVARLNRDENLCEISCPTCLRNYRGLIPVTKWLT